MEQTGEVVKAENGRLTIRFDRPESCRKCRACDGSTHQVLLEVAGSAEVGDRVKVQMPDGQVAKASFLAYLIPLAGLLLGLGVGAVFASGDLPVLGGGVLGLGAAFLMLHLNERRLRKDPRWHPQVTEVEKKLH